MYAQRLKALMALASVTAAQLSESSGVSIDTIRNHTRGKSASPRIDTVAKLAGALGYDAAVLLDGTQWPSRVAA